MDSRSYNQFCPVAMTAEILCSRWTILVVRELVAGRRRFNEIRRGLAGMSPGLLSRRLHQLEEAGVLERGTAGDGITHEYHLTAAGRALGPIIEAFGQWGERWVHTPPSLRQPNAAALMWDMRRALMTEPPELRRTGRTVVQFIYPDQVPARRNWWIVIDGGTVDVCGVDPGLAPHLYMAADLRAMTAVWMGLVGVTEEITAGRLRVTGDAECSRWIRCWLDGGRLDGERGRSARPAHP